MAVKLLAINDVYNIREVKYIVDEESEKNLIPDEDKVQGTKVLVIEGSKEYRMDSAGNWIEITTSGGGSGGVEVESLSVTKNGTYTAEEGKAYSPVNVNVPNTYAAGDEGKVVSNGALVAQTSDSVTENGTVDTTLINSLEVNVSGGGGDGVENAIIERSISGKYVNSNVSTIGFCAFDKCEYLTEVNMPNVVEVSANAFSGCTNLSSISLPNVKSISYGAFWSCAIENADFPLVETFAGAAFSYCLQLKTVSFPKITTLPSGMFSNCQQLEDAYLPLIASIGSSAFINCSRLSQANFPEVSEIGNSAFSGCSSLTTASFPKCTYIGSSTFYKCFRLLSFYLLGSSVVSLQNGTAFYSTPISTFTQYTQGIRGSIYVPASLYDAYISAPWWSAYSSRFVSV